MRVRLYVFLIVAMAMVTSCINCDCTNHICSCYQLAIRLEANVENSKAGAYEYSEITDFYVVRTDSVYKAIDSVNVTFSLVDSTAFSHAAWVYPNLFANFKDFKDYKFLVKNNKLNSIDTLSGLTYAAKQKEYLCNECTGDCEDSYLTCLEYSDVYLFHNGINIEGFSARLKKQ